MTHQHTNFKILLAGILVSFLISASTSITSSQNCIPPPSDLIGWWPGDGNTLDIAHGHHGTPQNGVTFAAGMVGQAFSFDGIDDFVEIPEDGSLDLNSDFTVDAWVKPNDLSGPITRPIVSKYSFAGVNWPNTAWELSARTDGKVQFGVICGTTDLSSVTTSPVVSVGGFTHLSAVYRQSVPSVEIYVDGALQAGNAGGSCTAINQNDIPVRIGMRIDAAVTTFFNGFIDEVEIYNRALSASEIQAIYNAGNAGKCKAIAVAIDIKPDTFPNSINLGSNGVVPVAILSSATFDATTVNPTTVTLAGASVKLRGHGTPMACFQDVNSDGRLDLVVQMSTEALQLSDGDTQATLSGQTFGGQPITGTDSVRVVP